MTTRTYQPTADSSRCAIWQGSVHQGLKAGTRRFAGQEMPEALLSLLDRNEIQLSNPEGTP